MESWITWIIQVVAYGIICFLLKRELNQFDQRDKRLQERIDEGRKWDIRDGILSLGGELFK